MNKYLEIAIQEYFTSAKEFNLLMAIMLTTMVIFSIVVYYLEKGLNFLTNLVVSILVVAFIIALSIFVLANLPNTPTTIPEEAYVPAMPDYSWFFPIVVVAVLGLFLTLIIFFVYSGTEEPEQSWMVVSHDENHIILHNNPNIEQYKKFPIISDEIVNQIIEIIKKGNGKNNLTTKKENGNRRTKKIHN
jgi:hypothetical protein